VGSTTLARKRIYANFRSYPNSKPNSPLKAQLCFQTDERRHFSIKCIDTIFLRKYFKMKTKSRYRKLNCFLH